MRLIALDLIAYTADCSIKAENCKLIKNTEPIIKLMNLSYIFVKLYAFVSFTLYIKSSQSRKHYKASWASVLLTWFYRILNNLFVDYLT